MHIHKNMYSKIPSEFVPPYHCLSKFKTRELSDITILAHLLNIIINNQRFKSGEFQMYNIVDI